MIPSYLRNEDTGEIRLRTHKAEGGEVRRFGNVEFRFEIEVGKFEGSDEWVEEWKAWIVDEVDQEYIQVAGGKSYAEVVEQICRLGNAMCEVAVRSGLKRDEIRESAAAQPFTTEELDRLRLTATETWEYRRLPTMEEVLGAHEAAAQRAVNESRLETAEGYNLVMSNVWKGVKNSGQDTGITSGIEHEDADESGAAE